jgi:hypothetical protein
VGRKHVVRSPDGRVWTITVSRLGGLFSSRPSIRARSGDVTAQWRADRRDARHVAAELAELLASGYDWESPAGAEFVGRTEGY